MTGGAKFSFPSNQVFTVLVGRLHVEPVTRLQRADVARDYLLGRNICLSLTADVRNHSCAQERCDDDGSDGKPPEARGSAV